jgi:hypothetical protein
MHRLLVSSLWTHYNMQSPGSRCNAFWPRSDLGLQHFLDGLLLDDEVLIPTQDYIALPVIVLSRLSWKWRKRSPVKIAERTREEAAKALHGRRKSRHFAAAFGGERGGVGPVRGTGSAADGLLSVAEGVL